jgi:uncharacterized protein (DUF58 family)
VLFRDETLDAMAEPHRVERASTRRALPEGTHRGSSKEPSQGSFSDDIKPADLYQRAAAAEAILWRDRLVRDLQEAGALVLHVSPGKLTPNLINRYLRIKAERLL